MQSFLILQLVARNESNVREPLPLLQLGTDTPESLRLLLCKGRIPYQHGIASRPIKRDAGRSDGIAIVNEHMFGPRKNRTDFPILFGKILYVIGHERLRRALIYFRFVLRI